MGLGEEIVVCLAERARVLCFMLYGPWVSVETDFLETTLDEVFDGHVTLDYPHGFQPRAFLGERPRRLRRFLVEVSWYPEGGLAVAFYRSSGVSTLPNVFVVGRDLDVCDPQLLSGFDASVGAWL